MSELNPEYGMCMATIAKGGVDNILANRQEFLEVGSSLVCNHCDACQAKIELDMLEPITSGSCRHSRAAVVLGKSVRKVVQ